MTLPPRSPSPPPAMRRDRRRRAPCGGAGPRPRRPRHPGGGADHRPDRPAAAHRAARRRARSGASRPSRATASSSSARTCCAGPGATRTATGCSTPTATTRSCRWRPGSVRVAAGVPLVVTAHYHGGGHTPLRDLLHIPYRPVAAPGAPRRRIGHRGVRGGGRLAGRATSGTCRIHVLPNGVEPGRPRIPTRRLPRRRPASRARSRSCRSAGWRPTRAWTRTVPPSPTCRHDAPDGHRQGAGRGGDRDRSGAAGRQRPGAAPGACLLG